MSVKSPFTQWFKQIRHDVGASGSWFKTRCLPGKKNLVQPRSWKTPRCHRNPITSRLTSSLPSGPGAWLQLCCLQKEAVSSTAHSEGLLR